MNQKELSELHHRCRLDKNAVSRIYGCFVNGAKKLVTESNESFGVLPQEESEKYLSLLKKSLTGTIGRNLINIAFTTKQVMDSEKHRLLMRLRTSKLRDDQARKKFYETVIASLDLDQSNYLILLAHDAYDVPLHRKDAALRRREYQPSHGDKTDQRENYLLIPLDNSVEFNGFAVEVKSEYNF